MLRCAQSSTSDPQLRADGGRSGDIQIDSTIRRQCADRTFYRLHLVRRLQSVQNAAARLIFKLRRFDHITDALVDLHWLRASECERVVYIGLLQDRRADVH